MTPGSTAVSPVPQLDIGDMAAMIARARLDALPGPVVTHALYCLVNAVGCMVGGLGEEAVVRTEKALLRGGASGRCQVIGRAGGYSAASAALINAMAGAVNAFDDTHAEAVVHPGPPIAAALIALASGCDQPVSGADFLAAFIWGVELSCRLSKSISVAPAHSDIAWSQTGIAACVGAAAASSRLLDLSEEETRGAIGIAASYANGLRVAHGSMAMHLAPARAAAGGVEAALFAGAGLTSPQDALQGKMGFFQGFARQAEPHYLYEGLGERFELLALTFKPYPCGIVIHPVIDACLALSSTPGLGSDAIEDIELQVAPIAASLADRPHPDSVFAAQVSLQHWAAASLLQGRAGLAQAGAEAIEDPDIAQVRGRCRVTPRADLAPDAATVILRLAGDVRRQIGITHCLGSIANPFGGDGVARKFLQQATPLLGDSAADALLESCWQLAASDDVRSIWAQLKIEDHVSARTIQ